MRHECWILPIVLALTACDEPQTEGDELDETIPFVGEWSRDFTAGPGNIHTATYLVEPDEIRYTLTGPIGNADYVMIRDAFDGSDNRFVGHTDEDKYYLVFVRDITEDSITLYKQEVESLDEGLDTAIPANDTTLNHGWNTYGKIE